MRQDKHTCIRCGWCCRQSIIEDIYEVDLIREPRLRKYVTPIKQTPGLGDEEQRYFLKTPCPFLEWYSRGKKNKWWCSIYATRPTICVAYEPGSSRICSLYKGV